MCRGEDQRKQHVRRFVFGSSCKVRRIEGAISELCADDRCTRLQKGFSSPSIFRYYMYVFGKRTAPFKVRKESFFSSLYLLRNLEPSAASHPSVLEPTLQAGHPACDQIEGNQPLNTSNKEKKTGAVLFQHRKDSLSVIYSLFKRNK